MPAMLLKVIAEAITVQMELARHGAHTFWGLLTRTAATIAAHCSASASATTSRTITRRGTDPLLTGRL